MTQFGGNDGVALASAARTATTTSPDISQVGARGVIVVLNVTALVDTPIITLTIDGKDELSEEYYNLLTGAAINVAGASVNKYVVYPGVTVAANLAVSHPIPQIFRVVVAHTDADSVTYSVGYSLVA